MDVEDEPNSYLTYLHNSETPNTYLLENNEVGLFSVEPIFTEMEATDWPQEGFPLLLTNSLITEETGDLKTGSIDNNISLNPASDIIQVPECAKESIVNTSTVEVNQNRTRQSENSLLLLKNSLILDKSEVETPKEIQFSNTEVYVDQNTQLVQNNEPSKVLLNNKNNTVPQVKFNKNFVVIKERMVKNFGASNENGLNNTTNAEPQLKTSKKLVTIQSTTSPSMKRKIQLLLPNGSLVSLDNPLPNVQVAPKKVINSQNKPKTVNDLFSTVVANKCKICSFLCENLEQIKKHISTKHPEFMLTHNGVSNGSSILLSSVNKKIQQNNEVNKEFTIYVCSECRGVCTDKNDLKKHMINVHGLAAEPEQNEEPSELTQTEYQQVKKMYSHLDEADVSLVKKQERLMQKIKCSVVGCQAAFPNNENRKKHEKLHIGDTRSMFKCSECEKTFTMWAPARSHLYVEHGVDLGMIICPVCSIFKSYKSDRVFKHMRIHSDLKQFVCTDCGKAFKQMAQLKNHEALHKLPEDMPTWAKVKKCDKCQLYFANSKSLKTHVKSVHENIKPFTCNICGHKSARKAMLELHMRQHTASKPYKCDRCHFRTGDHNSFRKHVMKHLGVTLYQCQYCSFKCIQSGTIKHHVLTKHKNKGGVYFCKLCSFSTVNEAMLSMHEKKHESSNNGIGKESATPGQSRNVHNDLQTNKETCFLPVTTAAESQIAETMDDQCINIPEGLDIPLVLYVSNSKDNKR